MNDNFESIDAARLNSQRPGPEPEETWMPGWYIAPAIIIGLGLWGMAFYGLGHLVGFLG